MEYKTYTARPIEVRIKKFELTDSDGFCRVDDCNTITLLSEEQSKLCPYPHIGLVPILDPGNTYVIEEHGHVRPISKELVERNYELITPNSRGLK